MVVVGLMLVCFTIVRVVGWWAIEERSWERTEPLQVVSAVRGEGSFRFGIGGAVGIARLNPPTSMKLPPKVKTLGLVSNRLGLSE
jgi:hypothetical protein